MFGLFRKPEQLEHPGIGTFTKQKKQWKIDIGFRITDQAVSCVLNSESGLSGKESRPSQHDISLLKSFLDYQQEVEQKIQAALVREHQNARDFGLKNVGKRNVFTGEVMDENDVLPEIEGHDVWEHVHLLSMCVCSEKISECDGRVEIQIAYRWTWDDEHHYAISIGGNKVIRIDDC